MSARQASERPGAWIIRATSCMCGGNWAWLRRTETGAYEMQGCVCHHPWTLALRAGGMVEASAPQEDEPDGYCDTCRCPMEWLHEPWCPVVRPLSRP